MVLMLILVCALVRSKNIWQFAGVLYWIARAPQNKVSVKSLFNVRACCWHMDPSINSGTHTLWLRCIAVCFCTMHWYPSTSTCNSCTIMRTWLTCHTTGRTACPAEDSTAHARLSPWELCTAQTLFTSTNTWRKASIAFLGVCSTGTCVTWCHS